MNNEIPRIIHYCWFGSDKKPKSVQKFIDSWKKKLPEYTFMEWNERNCDLEQEVDYVKEAYQCKKYAFVSDYFRIKKLVEYGGVYLDTDVGIIRSFEKPLQKHEVVIGFESAGSLGTAFIATVPQKPLFKEFLESYANRHFLREDGSFDLTTINQSINPFFEKCGLNINEDKYQKLSGNIGVYPSDCFSAFNIYDWHPEPTKRTYTIHYMASSWQPKQQMMKFVIIKAAQKLIGVNNYKKLRAFIKGHQNQKKN